MILFIEIVNTLKNTKKRPNQPNMTAIDNMLEPKSRCRKFCILFSKIYKFYSTLFNYLLKMLIFKIQIFLNSFLFAYLIDMICELKFS